MLSGQQVRSLRDDALRIFQAALRAADGGLAVSRMLKPDCHDGNLRLNISGEEFPVHGRLIVLAVGKAALAMARAVEEAVGPDRIHAGLAVTKYGHTGSALRQVELLESGHPIPDANGVAAAARVEACLSNLTSKDLVLVLVSGGASALLPAPVADITLEDKQQTTDLLLRAGADIHQLNTVRKHLSRLKGGRLAWLAQPARVVALLLSDVIGDSLDVIGSGLCAPDRSTFADALAIVNRLGVASALPRAVANHLADGAAGNWPETPKPGAAFFQRVSQFIVGSNRSALEAAAREAEALGYATAILSTSLNGETKAVAGVHAEILREMVIAGHPLPPPACVLSGGETTVVVKGKGKGGRNQEFALAAAVSIASLPGCLLLSAGTDGTDGPTEAAGAIADGATARRAAALSISLEEYLAENDSYAVFQRLNDLVLTGPTSTNVMDVHILLTRPD